MKSQFYVSFHTICIYFLIFLSCNDSTSIQPPPSILPYAFINLISSEDPKLEDSLQYCVIATVHPNDTLQFLGFAVQEDSRIMSMKWNFGDGKVDSGSIAFHSYRVSGTYQAIFSICDRWENVLSDSVDIFVNTPVDSVILISPANGAINIPLAPSLEWKGYDRDKWDTNLVYFVIILRSGSNPDTIIRWSTVSKTFLNHELTNNEFVSWYVMAKDRFGEIAKSEIFSFTTLPNLKNDSLLPLISPPSNILAIGISPYSIRISWEGISGAGSYNIQKSRELAGIYSKIGSTKDTFCRYRTRFRPNILL
jgi:hypothetical protein